MIDLDQHSDVLGDVTAAEEARLNELHDTLSARVDELRPKIADRSLGDDELAELGRITPALRDVTGERANRHAAREQQYGDAEAFLNEYDAAQAPADDSGEDTEAEATDESGDTGESSEQAPEAVAASGDKTGKGKPAAKAKTTPRVPPIGTTGQRADTGAPASHLMPVAVTAAGSGDTMRFDQVGAALANKLRAVRNGVTDGEMVPAVTLRASGVPDERYLHHNDPGRNTNKLDAVTSRTALVAAGGLCAPLEIDYSYQTIGVQGRPVRDSLPTFQADRGGIQFRPDVSPVTNVAAEGPRKATGLWTMADDEAVADGTDTETRKALWIVDCPDTTTAQVEAITLQTEWSNVTSRFDPETVQANQAAALIWHDRFAENHLLGQLRAASKVMTSAQVLGAVCDVLVTLDRAQAYYRSVHRLGANVQLRAIMPFWVRHLLRADLARRMTLDPMSALNISDAQIDSILSTRGLNPVWHLDGTDADQAEVAYAPGPPVVQHVPGVEAQQYTLVTPGAEDETVPNFPAQVDMLLHTEGHFTHLDGGTLDLGIVRDSTLIDRNRYRQFSETWEGVAARGVEALRLIASVWPTGETSGAVTVSEEGMPA